MIASPQIESCRPELAAIVHNVFETMLGLEVEALPPGPPSHSTLTAAVQFTGDWKGAVLLRCTEAQALAFTASMLQTDAPLAVDDEVMDVLGELANIIGGNLKSLLSPGVGLSMPIVVEGSDYMVHVCDGNHSTTVGFLGEAGIFDVTLVHISEH